MVLLLNVDDCLVYINVKDKNDDVYDSIMSDFKIEDGGDLNKDLRIEMGLLPYGLIFPSQPELSQRINNMIPSMENQALIQPVWSSLP